MTKENKDMNFFEELTKRFPETPKSILLKIELVKEGLKNNSVFKELSTWALPFTFIRSGQMTFAPSHFMLDDDTTIIILPKDESPYEFKKEGEDIFVYRNEEKIEKANFIKRPPYFAKKTSDGSLAATFFWQRGDSCICVSPLNYCEYFKNGDDCRYCGFNPGWEEARKYFDVKTVPNVDSVKEAVLMAKDEIPLDHIKLTGGAMYDTKKEANLYLKMVETLKKATCVEALHLVCQAFEKEDVQRLKDAGVTAVCYDFEVWNENIWQEVVPGKAKAVGRNEWLKRMVDAVDVFGKGYVSTSLVAGVEMAAENGFKSVNAALESTLEGFEWFIQNGIEPSFTVWTVAPGSKFDGLPAPPTEYYVKLGIELHKLLKKYNMYFSLGYEKLGENSSRRNLICYKCCFANTSCDYPRLLKD